MRPERSRHGMSPLGAYSPAPEVQRNSGQPLPKSARRFFESRMGHDFSHVRVHSDRRASDAAQSINARAFTLGQDVFFNTGEYSPNSSTGKYLLAHELTHTVQQKGSGSVHHIQRLPLDTPGFPGSTNYAFDTRNVTEAHLSDPDIIARFRALTPAQLIEYRSQVADPAVQNYITGLLATQMPAATAPPPVATPATPTTPAQSPQGAVAAPAAAPTFTTVAHVYNWQQCGPRGSTQQQHTRHRACVFHTDFINAFQQAIHNIEQVPSPYSRGVVAFYRPLLGLQPSQPDGSFPKIFGIGNVTIPVSSGVSIPVPAIALTLIQNTNITQHGHYVPGSNAITLNEFSFGILNVDVQSMERTLYHEAIHLFEDLITQRNQAIRSGTAQGTPVHTELDEHSRAPHAARFRSQARALWVTYLRRRQPPMAAAALNTEADRLAGRTWNMISGEAIARIEENIYARLRAGQGFTHANLAALQQSWLHSATYWLYPPNEEQQVQAFLLEQATQTSINTNILPIVQAMQQDFINARPAFTPPTSPAGQPTTQPSPQPGNQP